MAGGTPPARLKMCSMRNRTSRDPKLEALGSSIGLRYESSGGGSLRSRIPTLPELLLLPAQIPKLNLVKPPKYPLIQPLWPLTVGI